MRRFSAVRIATESFSVGPSSSASRGRYRIGHRRRQAGCGLRGRLTLLPPDGVATMAAGLAVAPIGVALAAAGVAIAGVATIPAGSFFLGGGRPRARQRSPPVSPRRLDPAAGRRTTRAARRSPGRRESTTASFPDPALVAVAERLVAARRWRGRANIRLGSVRRRQER